MLAQHAFKGAPYPNTTDFLALLRARVRPQDQQVVTDLFDRIALLDLKAGDATARKLPNGKYEVKVAVSARKFYADGAGKETEVPMDEQVELGVFSTQPGSKGFGPKDVLLLEKVRVQRDAHAVDDGPSPAGAASAPHGWISPRSGATARAAPRPDANGVLTVVVDGLPAWIGIDPYNKRIDRDSEDNLAPVDVR
jgi:ABC-2 type transport system permease protein